MSLLVVVGPLDHTWVLGAGHSRKTNNAYIKLQWKLWTPEAQVSFMVADVLGGWHLPKTQRLCAWDNHGPHLVRPNLYSLWRNWNHIYTPLLNSMTHARELLKPRWVVGTLAFVAGWSEVQADAAWSEGALVAECPTRVPLPYAVWENCCSIRITLHSRSRDHLDTAKTCVLVLGKT